MTKHIFVNGGVVSSLGKGITEGQSFPVGEFAKLPIVMVGG